MGVTQKTEVLLRVMLQALTVTNFVVKLEQVQGKCTLHIYERATPSCHMKLHPKHNMQKNSSYIDSGYAIVHRTNHNSREQTPSIHHLLMFSSSFHKASCHAGNKSGYGKLDGFSYVPTMLPKSIANTR
jgi:hypothetical protein